MPRHKSVQKRMGFLGVLLITNAWGCREHAVPQEELDFTVQTWDSHRHGVESRASSGALLEDVVALSRPQESKDRRHWNGAPTCVGRSSHGLVATRDEKLQWTLTKRGPGVVLTMASRVELPQMLDVPWVGHRRAVLLLQSCRSRARDVRHPERSFPHRGELVQALSRENPP